MLSKEFPDGILVRTGANSATGLRSMPARYLFLDETAACHCAGCERSIAEHHKTAMPEAGEWLW